MSSPKAPSQQQLLALTDPNNVTEAFANTLVGLGIRDGIAHVTLSVVRPRHNTIGGATQDEQVMSARVAMPVPTLAALAQAFTQLQTAMRMQATAAGKPN
jgi:hypothetical protein